MSSSRSAACSRRRRVAALARAAGRGAGGACLRCGAWRGRRRSRCRLRSGGCGSWTGWRAASATYKIPLAVRLTGALDRAALEAALGDLVARHESLRTIFPETLRGAAAADPGGGGGAAAACGCGGERGGACRSAGVRRRGAALILRASCRCGRICLRWGSASRCCCCCCITLPGDGWSLAPLLRDLAAAVCGALPRGGAALCRRCRCNMPTTRCGSSGAGRGEDPRERDSRQLAYWREALAGLPDQLDLPSDRPRPAVASYRGDSVAAARSTAELHGGLLGLGARRAGRACSWCCRPALAALLTRLGAGSDIPIGSPIAGRTDSALDDLVGFFVNTLVLRTDTSGNPSFRELIGAGARGQSCGLQPPGPAVRAAGGGAQPGALAGAPSAVPGDAGVAEHRRRAAGACRAAGRALSRWRRRARSSTCR